MKIKLIQLTLTLLLQNKFQIRVAEGFPVLQGCFFRHRKQLWLDNEADSIKIKNSDHKKC